MIGKIIKLTGGIYTVVDDFGKTYNLKPRGIFRYKELSPKVGDNVEFSEDVIEKVLPRHNDLIRPQISNIDQAILINAALKPNFSFDLLDRFLILIEAQNIKPVIIVTKIDLLDEEALNTLKEKMKYYEKMYKVIFFSKHTLDNIEEVKNVMSGKVSVLAGQTGAGKSSLLNALDPTLELATNEISEALGRGKHTTRHVELIKYQDALIADSPGFSKLDFYNIKPNQLKDCYPDFVLLEDECRFNGCIHVNEPGCKIKEEYNKGNILKSRYENYVRLYEEIKSIKIKY